MASYMNHFSLLQTISLFYFLITLTCTGASLSLHEECFALYQFKQSIIHQDDEFCAVSWFQTFHSWKPTSNTSIANFNCCSWYGVECSNDHVVGLDLSESFLCGHINSTSTLFSLIHLRSLNLAINNFGESQITSEIAHLKQLRSLNLSQSGFSGRVPSEISQLMHLSSLDLSKNTLKNTLELQSPDGLKNLVQNLTGLEQLHLSGVAISSSVPHFLANLSSLRSIVLQDCSLQNEFPVTILELPKLRILNVALNTNLIGSFHEFHNSLLEYVNLGLTGFFGIIPESISNLNHLTFLRLSECSFTGRIPSALSNLTQLKALGLGNNEFTSLIPSLVSLSQLNILELSGNEFQKRHLPNWLGKMTKLTDLYLYDMNINGEIPHFLANLTKLGVVAMGRNFLTGHIPSWFFNVTQLRVLDVQQNQLHGPIASSFSNLKSTLQDLTLSENNFSGRVDLDMFLGFQKLENLVLDNNMLSVVATNNYTNTTLLELKVLGLSACNLKEFPAPLRFQSKLEVLSLNNNEIDGLLPVWIWNYSQETLQMIDLGGNSITGEIPPSICEVKSLLHLDLSFNNMSGPIPPCLGSLRSLVVLNLRKNNFHGIMMNAFMHGSMLKNIDLSENGFTGQLPRSLTNCTNLEVLSLGDNTFHDVFPFWLGTLARLGVLVLRSNKLYGQIQSSTTLCSQFPKLRIIDLSDNGFSSQLHQKYFQACNAMTLVYDGESSVMESKMS